MRRPRLTVRSGQALRLGAALVVLLAFLAVHIVESAAVATHSDAHAQASATAERTIGHSEHPAPSEHHGHSEHPEPSEGQSSCDHDDGHEHDRAAAEVSAAPPRTGDDVAAVPSELPVADWSVAGVVLLLRVRRRRGVSCPAASPRGRDLLISVCVSRE